MAEKVIMPKQGLQMTEGTITNWIVQEGGACTEGEPLFEMETDKLTITMDSPATGTLLKIVHGDGDVVPITNIIGVIGEPGEDISLILAEAAAEGGAADSAADTVPAPAVAVSAAPTAPGAQAVQASVPVSAGGRIFSTPRARMRADEKGIAVQEVPPTGPEKLIIERDVLNYQPQTAPKASPLAKKVAELENVALDEASGTGARGKIMKDDIMAVVAKRAAAKAEGGASARGTHLIPLTRMRKIIAQRMLDSLHNEAQLTHAVRVDMTNAAALRAAYKKQDKKISYNDIVLYAASRALVDFPMMNSFYTDEGIEMHDYVNLGMAVDIGTGLVVPNLKNADLMTLSEISTVSRELAAQAKNNTLGTDAIQGGTFTVSNLGMFGLDEFTAIINAPESGILAVGAITQTPVVVDGQVVVRPIMSITLTYDHRVADGAPAAKFLKRIKDYIEEPTLML